ncbi:F-box only protein 44-like [Babylonia areolata]|uniref:F-box only protein 44-like n=1 Tax=Babylonia areolata TaxID=304850 RepID=UPI003FD44ACA
MLLPAKDVVLHCSLVCRSWLAACRDPCFWQQKCEAENKFVPKVSGQPPKNFVMLYFKEPYTRNLLRNTHAVDGLSHWSQPRGCQIVNVEDSPEGAYAIRDYIPAEEIQGKIQNWVTSYRYTFLTQSVVLLEEGCSRAVLDELRPPIAVSAWCAAHEESGAKFYMLVRLIDKRKKEAGHFETEVDLSNEALRKIWHKMEHTFTDYRPGVRKVVFKMGGVATQSWRGQFGAKFTLPCVRFAFNDMQTERQSPEPL